MTILGLLGWLLLVANRVKTGLVLLRVYAMCGLSSIGHYWATPLSAHRLAMNATILAEVTVNSIRGFNRPSKWAQ